MSADDLVPVLIGEAPSKGGDRFHMFPLSGPPARVLCQLAGIPPQEGGTTYGRWTWALYERFECRNVFDRYRDSAPWSAPKAAQRLRDALPELSGRVVVCLGRRPQKALYDALDFGPHRFPDPYDFHEWAVLSPPLPAIQTIAIPHPSGLNRALNDADERERCGETLRRALELARPAPGVAS